MMASTSFLHSLPEAGSIGRPRLDKYSKLIARFYEPYFIVCSLGRTRDSQTGYPRTGSAAQAQRREFMRNLAFICDGRKGGMSFTAFGVAEVEGSYVFYMASRLESQCKRMLEGALAALDDYVTTAGEDERHEKRRSFVQMCIDHASKRIHLYIIDLNRAIEGCVDKLASRSNPTDTDMAEWLKSLRREKQEDAAGHFYVCLDMFAAAGSPHFERLRVEASRQERLDASQGIHQSKRNCFANARHYVGRLAARMKKPCDLLEHAQAMRQILANCQVVAIPALRCPPVPLSDGHTTVDSILRRILGKDDALQREQVKRSFMEMNEAMDGRLLTGYKDNDRYCKPFVHGEICVLEYFYSRRLRFLGGDSYVFSSKPACFSCKLYFKHHPAYMVVPESHGKAYINWGPPFIENFRSGGDLRSDIHRNVMNKIIQDVRDEMLDQLRARTFPHRDHPDSTTGVSGAASYQEDFFGSSHDTHEHGLRQLSWEGPGNDSGVDFNMEQEQVVGEDEDTSTLSVVGSEAQHPTEAVNDETDEDDEEGGARL